MSRPDPREAERLRRDAVERLTQSHSDASPIASETEPSTLAQELEIHRVELELQNEELRETQIALQAGLDRYTQLFDFAPIGYATLAPDGTVREINHIGASLLEEIRSRVVGKRFAQFIVPSHRPEFDEVLARVLAEHVAKTCEVELVRVHVERPVARLTASSLVGQEASVLMAFEDITAQKRAERRLRQADLALRDADRRKDEFLAVLSHELRTPLASILMYAQLLQQGGLTDAEVRRSGEVMQRSARTQARLIDDLLDVSRIVSGKLTLKRDLVNLAATVQSAVDAVASDAKGAKIRFEVVIDPDVPPAFGDPVRLQQAVWNLLTNAIKFTPPRGRIEVALNVVDRQAHIAVRDTGTGIEPEFLPHIFVRFAQGDTTTTRSAGGLGLGLSIAASIVEAHGGTIRAASEGRGKGSTFTILLPTAKTPAATKPVIGRRSDTRIQGARLLVVEDDAGTRATLTQVLERSGATVRDADSGRAAMKVLARFKPDVVLCDIAMPEEDGCSLLRRIRARGKKRGGDVPAVALTAFAGDEARARTEAAGFEEHLVKPIDIDHLLTTVSRLLPRKNHRPSAARAR